MGIDIYAQWNDQTKDERAAQSSHWLSVESGSVGYLREAYHGEPYATRFLCAEAFASDTAQARIPAATLRARLDETLRLVEERERTLYEADDQEVERRKRTFRDFVALCEEKERETGESVLIVASY